MHLPWCHLETTRVIRIASQRSSSFAVCSDYFVDWPIGDPISGIVKHLRNHFAPSTCVTCLLNLNKYWHGVAVQKQMVQGPTLGAFRLVGYGLFAADKEQPSFRAGSRAEDRWMISKKLLKYVLRSILTTAKFYELVVSMDYEDGGLHGVAVATVGCGLQAGSQ
jgi:hypothetical protein